MPPLLKKAAATLGHSTYSLAYKLRPSPVSGRPVAYGSFSYSGYRNNFAAFTMQRRKPPTSFFPLAVLYGNDQWSAALAVAAGSQLFKLTRFQPLRWPHESYAHCRPSAFRSASFVGNHRSKLSFQLGASHKSASARQRTKRAVS